MIKILILVFILMIVTYPPLLNGDKGVLRVGIHTFPDSLNPVYSTDETSVAICNKIYEALFYFDSKGNISNCLANKAEMVVKDGNMLIEVELKKKIYFSTGKEFEADDILETVKLLQNREFKYPYLSQVDRISQVKKLNRYRVRFYLQGMIASWKTYLSFKILNCRQLVNASTALFRRRRLSGTGPYQVDRVIEQSRIMLRANGYYNRGHQLYPAIQYQLMSYTHLAPLKLLADEIDICEFQPESVLAYRKLETWQRKFRIIKYKKFGYTYLVFNLNNSAITRNIRQHVYNLLYGGFTKRFLAGRGDLVYTPFLMLNHNIKPASFKPVPLKSPLTLTILCNSQSNLRKRFILFFKESLKAVGIKLKTVFLEYHTFLDYIKKGKYDLALSGFLLDIDYDMKEILHSESYFNYANFKSPEMDHLLEQGLVETDASKRKQLYLHAHDIWLEQLPMLPLFNLYYYKAVANDVKIPAQTYQLVGSTGDFLDNIQEWSMRRIKAD